MLPIVCLLHVLYSQCCMQSDYKFVNIHCVLSRPTRPHNHRRRHAIIPLVTVDLSTDSAPTKCFRPKKRAKWQLKCLGVLHSISGLMIIDPVRNQAGSAVRAAPDQCGRDQFVRHLAHLCTAAQSFAPSAGPRLPLSISHTTLVPRTRFTSSHYH